jgi:hypothetical protein
MSKLKLEKCFKQKVDNNWNEFWRLGNLFYPNPDPEDLLVEEIRSLGKMFYDVITDEYQFNSTLTKGEFRQVKINSFILDDKN